MRKIVENGYIWECPVCYQTSKTAWRCQFTARRHGVLHISQLHQGSKTTPIIKEWSLVKKPPCKKPDDAKHLEPLKQGQFWYEIEHIPSFNIKPEDKLLIPHHIFVTKKVFKKIQKQEA